MTRLRDGIRIYGSWGGNPAGWPENPAQCIEEIRSGEPGDHGHQCRSKRTVGDYCGKHSPAAKQQREADRDRKYNLYMLTNQIHQQRLVVSEAARNVFKQAATYDDLAAEVAELERLIDEKELL